jgi:GNAT superfamily N-acetyltransferase
MTVLISAATSDEDFAAFGDLIVEYWQWIQARYVDLPGFVATIGEHQELDAERASLKSVYAPPRGTILLAKDDGVVVGGVGLKPLDDDSCEMKRLYVSDRYQGHGVGRLLCASLIAEATAIGFELMRLDTGFDNAEALKLYESLGFTECPPYHDYPPEIAHHLHFMQRPL